MPGRSPSRIAEASLCMLRRYYKDGTPDHVEYRNQDLCVGTVTADHDDFPDSPDHGSYCTLNASTGQKHVGGPIQPAETDFVFRDR